MRGGGFQGRSHLPSSAKPCAHTQLTAEPRSRQGDLAPWRPLSLTPGLQGKLRHVDGPGPGPQTQDFLRLQELWLLPGRAGTGPGTVTPGLLGQPQQDSKAATGSAGRTRAVTGSQQGGLTGASTWTTQRWQSGQRAGHCKGDRARGQRGVRPGGLGKPGCETGVVRAAWQPQAPHSLCPSP